VDFLRLVLAYKELTKSLRPLVRSLLNGILRSVVPERYQRRSLNVLRSSFRGDLLRLYNFNIAAVISSCILIDNYPTLPIFLAKLSLLTVLIILLLVVL
jgi:hypothetical protein